MLDFRELSLYFDENLRHSVAGQLRSDGDDIVTAAEAGLAGVASQTTLTLHTLRTTDGS